MFRYIVRFLENKGETLFIKLVNIGVFNMRKLQKFSALAALFLYLVGCGNMATLGTSNPTLTASALSIWAADNILKDLN